MRAQTRSIWKRVALSVLLAVPAARFAVAVSADPSEVCSTETYEFRTSQRFVPWAATLNSGIIVPAPAPSTTLRVVSATYTTYDRYPDGQIPNRATADQQHESVGISIGGTLIGGLSADVPDSVGEGAPTNWYSGLVTGSFGGSGTVLTGGELVIRHASLYGFNESPNSIQVDLIRVVLERCAAPPPTTSTTTTTVPPTTSTTSTTVPPTTSTTSTTVPPTTSTTSTTVPPTTSTTSTTVPPTTSTTTTTVPPTSSTTSTTVPPTSSTATTVAPPTTSTTVPPASSSTTSTTLVESRSPVTTAGTGTSTSGSVVPPARNPVPVGRTGAPTGQLVVWAAALVAIGVSVAGVTRRRVR